MLWPSWHDINFVWKVYNSSIPCCICLIFVLFATTQWYRSAATTVCNFYYLATGSLKMVFNVCAVMISNSIHLNGNRFLQIILVVSPFVLEESFELFIFMQYFSGLILHLKKCTRWLNGMLCLQDISVWSCVIPFKDLAKFRTILSTLICHMFLIFISLNRWTWGQFVAPSNIFVDS